MASREISWHFVHTTLFHVYIINKSGSCNFSSLKNSQVRISNRTQKPHDYLQTHEKLLKCDWVRAVQFKCNTSAKSVTPVQITHRNSES